MRKNINKLATLVMTGALAASMSFGAFADTNTGVFAPDSTNSILIKKNVTTDGKTMAPNTSFNLEITTPETGDHVIKTGNLTVKGQAYPDVKKGLDADKIVVTPAKFAPDATTNPSEVYTNNFKLDFSRVTFADAGIYSYKVHEVQGTYAGITYENKYYDMYVFVVNDNNTRKISYVVFADEDTSTKTDTIVNKYGKGSNNEDLAHDLYITKEVAGPAANMSEKFHFQIKVNPDEAGEMFSVYAVGTDGKDAERLAVLTCEKDGDADTKNGVYSNTIEVQNGTKLHVQGLTSGDTVVVKEVEANQKGYTSKFYINDGSANATDLTNGEASYTNVADGDVLTIQNFKDAITPTGVAMDIAPYALMMALAGGAAATFLRKKESFED